MSTTSVAATTEKLDGMLSIKLKPGKSLNDFCAKFIANYNPDRFEALAVKFYHGKEDAVTLYAIDKERQEGNNYSADKMPVKKFKLDSQFIQDFLSFIENLNFTVSTGNFPMDDMQVINK